jgi:hypothetical protein
MGANDVAVLGVGMHPWGKWGRNFVEYGVAAARDACATPASPGATCSSCPAPTPCATATPATSPGPPSPRPWAGPAPGWPPLRRLRVGRHRHRGGPHPDPGRAVRRGPRGRRRHHPEGLPRPQRRRPPDRPGLAALPPRRRHQPHLLRPGRPPPHGPLRRHEHRLRQGQGQERPQRPHQPQRPLPEGRHRRGRAGLPVVADPLHLLEICATSDGGAAIVLTSMAFAERHAASAGSRCASGVSTVSRPRTRTPSSTCPTWPPTPPPSSPPPSARSSSRSPTRPTRRPASAPRTSRWPRSTTCPPPSSSTGTRTSACASAARPRSSSTTATRHLGGRIPVNPSGGLACFGEAVPAQAIAQVCELTWQLRGQATGRQVEGLATAGITANQGLFGHGSGISP